MKELANIPKSIADEIQKAADLLAESRLPVSPSTPAQVAAEKRNEALAILDRIATTQPHLSALLLGTLAGFTQLEDITVDESTEYRQIERKWLGLTVAVESIPVTTTRTVKRTFKLS
jgi:hypothetical protein